MTPAEKLEQIFGVKFELQPSILAVRQFHASNTFCVNEKEEIIGLAACENDFEEINLPSEDFQYLQYLNLSDNKSLRKLNFKGALLRLEHLDLSDAGLESFMLPVGFRRLKHLDLSRNQIKEVKFAGDLPKLWYFDLTNNQVKELQLSARQLEYLFLNDNQLQRLVFANIPDSLRVLHLRNNQLEKLPDHFLSLTKLEVLYVHGNSLSDIPRDVIGEGEDHNALEEVQAYLRAIEASGGETVYLHQAKMIYVGNGEVGKTSIRVRLEDPSFPLPVEGDRTPGLDLSTYFVNNLESDVTGLPEPINFQLNVWDFGGQGKYREVQQLFCSRKSLYLFVTSFDDVPGKEDYCGFEYWLAMVNAYGYDRQDKSFSPVIHVVNKIDLGDTLINEKERVNKFPNVRKFVKVSAKTLENFKLLENSIREVLPKISSNIFTDDYPPDWMAVKAELEKQRPQHHITREEYLSICRSNNLDDRNAKVWLRTLDRIGTVIYFGDDEALKDWIILDPDWVKTALFHVLDDTDFIENGLLKPKHLSYIWRDYSETERRKLVALMQEYELIYPQKGNHDQLEYIVPSMLNDAIPHDIDHPRSPVCELRFDFAPFIPAGTVNKLMVRLKDLIFRKLQWKNNVVLHDPHNATYAHISEDWENHRINLKLYGKEVGSLFQQIRAELHSLTERFRNTKYLHQLDFTVFAFDGEDWEEEKKLEKHSVEPFDFIWSNRMPHAAGKERKAEKVRPKVFVSYAHKVDSRYFKLFVQGIKDYSNWDIFDDRNILIGEDWHERLQKEVRACDFAIFLLSQQFFNSGYIQKHEFQEFIKRNAATGFPFFYVLLTDCDFPQWEEISKQQIFTAHGQDYDLAKLFRDKQISYDLLAKFDREGELIPNPYLNTFHKNFVAAVNQALAARKK